MAKETINKNLFSRYTAVNWGKDYLLPVANCKLPIVKKPSSRAGGLFVWGREGDRSDKRTSEKTRY
jgi:hypothetical protein